MHDRLGWLVGCLRDVGIALCYVSFKFTLSLVKVGWLRLVRLWLDG